MPDLRNKVRQKRVFSNMMYVGFNPQKWKYKLHVYAYDKSKT